jgi:lambda family phage portal protein
VLEKLRAMWGKPAVADAWWEAEQHALRDAPAALRREQFPAAIHKRMYASARQTRLTSDWYSPNNSADSELVASLQKLRARSRSLVRDSSYAKRAKVIVVNNIVGPGIYMEPQVKNQRGTLIDDVNDEIEAAWDEWSRAETCHTGGRLNFCDLERQAMGQIFEAGEILIRKHPTSFGDSVIPFALELIEPERLGDEYSQPIAGLAGTLRMGIERDSYGRPIGFWLREQHPGELRLTHENPDRLFRVAADQIFHLFPIDRWPQTRGEPWLHAAARKLNDMDGYSEAEIVAARGAASYMGFVESPEGGETDMGETPGTDEFELEPGAVRHLAGGEKFNMVSPNRPNPNMDPFMRLMLREVAAGAMVSYESLSRDYSQSNYSSSRLALLDDRDVWRVMQSWFIKAFREPLHRAWLQQAVLSGALPSIPVEQYVGNRRKFEAVAFKPRGWSWVDPTKEVDAYIAAVRAGFMTVGQVIALTGGGVDLEDVWSDRAAELEDAKDKKLVFTTDPGVLDDKGTLTEPPQPDGTTDAGEMPKPVEGAARVLKMRTT